MPELMPFRLTRQMAGAVLPHDVKAVLQEPCAAALSALRAGSDILEVSQHPSMLHLNCVNRSWKMLLPSIACTCPGAYARVSTVHWSPPLQVLPSSISIHMRWRIANCWAKMLPAIPACSMFIRPSQVPVAVRLRNFCYCLYPTSLP